MKFTKMLLLVAIVAVGIVAHCTRSAAPAVVHSDQTAATLKAMGE